MFGSSARRAGIALTIALVMGSGSALAQISGSDHDFSTRNPTVTDQTCIYCHTPHAATSNVVALWNRTNPAGSGFTMYASNTLSSGVMGTTPGPVSLACLSCHDGVGAVSNFGSRTGGTDVITGSRNIGTNLGNDHPIAIQITNMASYPDADIRTPNTWNLPLFNNGTNDALECATCHEPHSRGAAGMLRVSMSSSALCTTCHSK